MHVNFFRFFSSFRKFRLSGNLWVVFAIRFDRLLRNFFSVVRSLFAKTSKFHDLIVFSKKKLYAFGQINKLILAKKKLDYQTS